jgi:hypothetical protein
MQLPADKYYVEITTNEANEGHGDAYSIRTSGGAGSFSDYSSISNLCTTRTASVSGLQSRLDRAKGKLVRAANRVHRTSYGSAHERRTARTLYTRAKTYLNSTKKALRTAEAGRKPWCFIPR